MPAGSRQPCRRPRSSDRDAEAILVLNAGSSSIKFSVYALGVADRLSLDSKGQVEGIGSRPHFVAEDAKGRSLRDEAFEPSGPDGHGEAMRKLGGWLRERLADDRVVAAGHRVVHGGPDFAAPVTVDAAVLARLERSGAARPAPSAEQSRCDQGD